MIAQTLPVLQKLFPATGEFPQLPLFRQRAVHGIESVFHAEEGQHLSINGVVFGTLTFAVDEVADLGEIDNAHGEVQIETEVGQCLFVAAVARKLIVAIWYLMMGRWTTLKEIDSALNMKLGKIITKAGTTVLKQLKKTRREFRGEILESLKTGRTYVMDAEKIFIPHPGTG